MKRRLSFLPRFQPMNHPRLFRSIVNCWPPFLGAAISVEEIALDWRTIRVAMRLRWYNRNYVNSHFGGSLFSMTDPFYMLMLLRNLGSEYVVWDLAARIQYIRPGRGKVTAVFSIDADRLMDIKLKAESGEKQTEIFWADILDEQGERVAAVKKTLYIRKKLRLSSNIGADGNRAERPAGATSPVILSSRWGKMEVEGLGQGKDWKLWPGGGRNWDWSENRTGHSRGVQRGDVQELIDSGSKVVILTTGRLGRLKVPGDTVDFLQGTGIQVVVVKTGKGVDLYNEFVRSGTAVGALFHATC